MDLKMIESICIYLGGEFGIKPMVKVIYVVAGIKQDVVELPWDEPAIRNEKIIPYLTAYTLIDDTRIVD